MVAQSFHSLTKRLSQWLRLTARPQGWLILVLVLILSTGCTQIKLPVQRGDVSLDIRTVTAQPDGVYAIAGNTDLPKGTEITVAAVRLLTPNGAIAADLTRFTHS
jgi:hypothetical protein